MQDEVSQDRRSGAEVHPPMEIVGEAIGAMLNPAATFEDPPSAVPGDWHEISLGMSNFEHEVDEGLNEALRGGRVYGRHAGWNFNGLVWFDGEFKEEVWRYHEPVEVLSAPTLEALMEVVNEKYGWD